jgi:hypothetical protein
MESAQNKHVLAASRQLLEPLIQVLIHCGVTWREFSELAKLVFVDVATRRFGKRGRPTNVSRTSVLTGLARREIRKQRQRVESGPEALTGYVTKASLVLSAWHLDPQFLDADGKPAALPLDGEGATFTALLRHCGAGEVRPSTLLKELRSAGAVRKRPDGRVEALQRFYIPHAMDSELIRLWGTVLADIGTTYVHNLTRKAQMPTRFERAAVSDRVRAEALPEFREFLNREGQAFLERLDAWLTENEAPHESASQPATVRLGAGVYHIQD